MKFKINELCSMRESGKRTATRHRHPYFNSKSSVTRNFQGWNLSALVLMKWQEFYDSGVDKMKKFMNAIELFMLIFLNSLRFSLNKFYQLYGNENFKNRNFIHQAKAFFKQSSNENLFDIQNSSFLLLVYDIVLRRVYNNKLLKFFELHHFVS